MNTRTFGTYIEQHVSEYLKQQGLKLIANNFNCQLGEIDLIMLDNKTLVFVEVKSRDPCGLVMAHESVTVAKQRKIIKTAELYLQKNKKFARMPCRFDVVAVQHQVSDGRPIDLQWIKDAFQIS